jgi:SAM-dependent methyltransferase
MSYWENVWTRATTKGIYKAIHDVATKHSEGLMNKFVLPYANGLHSICELGSGSGFNSLYLASKLENPSVVLVDINSRILKSAVIAFQKRRVPVDARNVDMFTMGDDEQFDIVHSGGLLEHFDDPVRVFLLHLRVTRPGGICFISVPKNCWYWNGFVMLMKVFGEFTDQRNYKYSEFCEIIKKARATPPKFKIEKFSGDGIDIAITLRRTG